MVVWKLDRLGRNMLHILQTVKELTNRGVTLVSVTDGIDSSTPAGRMMIGVLGSLAEYERELTKERTALKRATSRANGTVRGTRVLLALRPLPSPSDRGDVAGAIPQETIRGGP